MAEIDYYGIPEFFITTVTTESAGHGNLRVFNYAKRCGILVPQCTLIIAAADLIVASRMAGDAAVQIGCGEEGMILRH